MLQRRLTTALILLVLIALPFTAQATPREQIPEKYKWNLGDMYPNKDAFLADQKSVQSKLPGMEKCQGHMGDSAKSLKDCLDLYFGISQQYSKMAAFTSMQYDENLKNQDSQKLKEETSQLGVTLRVKTAWMTPEILGIGEKKIDDFLKQEPGLAIYHHFLDDIVRTAAHTLTAPEEELLSRTGMISDAAYNAYSAYTSSDMIFPTIKLFDGTEVHLTQAAYTKYRALPNQADRKAVFDAFWAAFAVDQNTLGVLLNAQTQRDWFYAKSRKYDTSVASALDAYNIPVNVYTQLVSDVNKNLPSLHRYLNLRKKMLGLDKLHYYDTYPSIVKDVEIPYKYEESTALMEESLKPMGDEYLNSLKQGLASRWVDVYPNDGKRSGAYSSGSLFTAHPYLFLNFNDDYDSITTLTHEMGHTMHSYFSSKYQPYPTADYAIFVAEVASTFNEALLNNYLVSKETDPNKKLFLLGNQLERVRQTIFRQAMFAEFELETHSRVEKGETLTGEDLTKLYLGLLKKYYGNDQGVCEIDNAYGIEWAYIPHFYYNFYVYQYSTGQVASTALAEKVIEGQKGAVDRYIAFLKSGSSDYPIQLLKNAGVDLTTSEPFELAMKSFNRTMDQIEEILNSQKK